MNNISKFISNSKKYSILNLKIKLKKMFTTDIYQFKEGVKESLFNIFKFEYQTLSWVFLTSTILRWIAVITMFIDHIGLIAYPNFEELRIVGRIAFPIFAFLSVIAINYSRRPLYYTFRFLVMGSIIQIGIFILSKNGFNESLNPKYFNIMFMLFLGSFSAYLHRKNIYIGLIFTFLTFIFLFLGEYSISNIASTKYLFRIDYHSYGYLIIMMLYYAFLIGKHFKNQLIFKILGILFFTIVNIVYSYLNLISEIQIYSLVDMSLFLFYSYKKPIKFWLLNNFFLLSYPLSFVFPLVFI
ncbi:conjugal transfer protein TraX [Mycoplasma sp. CSL7503-lung]|uniref:conjugal transfer protein TraX n=1 Tax=Mycoplasma sp. CSL7503-lung TaxID=536372 RepID=UPI0021D1A7E6|nr:conjugal transfer protein TraX [Mycoplasma sp. CSL7503-lung]MCU4706357.1 conjugal transfer protein TraX [Mycoplasma sp. CSL7503-lung]